MLCLSIGIAIKCKEEQFYHKRSVLNVFKLFGKDLNPDSI